MPRHLSRSLATLARGGGPGRFSLRGRHVPQQAGHPGAAALAAARLAAVTALGDLPFAPLSPRERQVLGAQLHRTAGAVVDQVVRGIAAQPARFGDLLPQAARLGARQAEADGWRLLRGALGHLHGLASDSYLHAQAGALDEAKALIGQLQSEAAAAPEDPTALARLAAVVPALELLRDVAGRRRPQLAPKHGGGVLSALGALRDALRGPVEGGQPAPTGDVPPGTGTGEREAGVRDLVRIPDSVRSPDRTGWPQGRPYRRGER